MSDTDKQWIPLLSNRQAGVRKKKNRKKERKNGIKISITVIMV